MLNQLTQIHCSHYGLQDVGINEKVDVIVSDWMDQLLLYNYEVIFLFWDPYGFWFLYLVLL